MGLSYLKSREDIATNSGLVNMSRGVRALIETTLNLN